MVRILPRDYNFNLDADMEHRPDYNYKIPMTSLTVNDEFYATL